MSFDPKNFTQIFLSQFQDYSMDKDNTAIKFTAQDAEYRVYLPTMKHQKDNHDIIQLDVKIDHIRGGATDDHAEIIITYDQNGNIVDGPNITCDMGGDSQVPSWVSSIVKVIPKVTDVIVDTGELLLAPETEGVSVAVGEAIKETVKVAAKITDIAISVYNHFIKEILKITDDGGRLYFPDLITHVLTRLNASYMQTMLGNYTRTITFHPQQAADAIGAGNFKTDKNKKAVVYPTTGDQYRTWLEDVSVNYQNVGMVVSCKIDAIRNNNQDDHIALLAVYSLNGKLISAQSSVQMENEDTVHSGVLSYDENGNVVVVDKSGKRIVGGKADIIAAIDDVLEAEMKKSKHYDNYSKQRKNIPDVVQDNLRWMQQGVEVKG